MDLPTASIRSLIAELISEIDGANGT